MKKEKRSRFIKTIFTLIKVLPIIMRVISYVSSRIEQTAFTTGKYLLIILTLSLISLGLVTIGLLCLEGFIVLYLLSLQLNLLLAVFIIILLNMGLVFGVGIVLIKYQRDISFSETKEVLRNICL